MVEKLMGRVWPLAGAAWSAVLLLTQSAPSRSASAPSCLWRSESTPAVVIQVHPRDRRQAVNMDSATLLYRGRKVLDLVTFQPNGYGSLYWGTDGAENKTLLLFYGNQPAAGVRHLDRTQPRRVILAGLGSALWYGKDEWRSMPGLFLAAEGFWRLSPGCRAPGLAGRGE
jgi:hypothetical protein